MINVIISTKFAVNTRFGIDTVGGYRSLKPITENCNTGGLRFCKLGSPKTPLTPKPIAAMPLLLMLKRV